MSILNVKETLSIERHGFAIPVTPRRGPLARDRVLLVGDAASLVDPVTAEGITFAIRSGRIAASALIDSGTNGPRACRTYQRRIHQSILGELRAGRILDRLLYFHPRARRFLFGLYGQKLSEAMTDVVMGTHTYAGALRRPMSYLKLVGSS